MTRISAFSGTSLSCLRVSSAEQGGHPALPLRVGERGEAPLEIGSRGPLPGREAGRDLAHREQRHRRRRYFAGREHVGRQRPDFADLYLAVLKLSEAVLQALEVSDHLRVVAPIVQWGEELERVAQLLAAFAQVMEGFGGRLWGDGGAALGDFRERRAGPVRRE